MLSNEYKQVFSQYIDQFAVNILKQQQTRNYDSRYTLFYPLIGKAYPHHKSLLLVGQATNGWDPNFSVDNVRVNLSEKVEEAVKYSQVEGDACPLDWINTNWNNKQFRLSSSFFWNIAYKLVKKGFDRTDENWNHVITWSNLMKIAPLSGGNPNKEERDAQLEQAAKLFRMELDELQPQFVLLMTNLKDWAEPILAQAGIKYQAENGKFVEASAIYKGSRIIVTKRGHLKITHEDAINEVLQFMNDISITE